MTYLPASLDSRKTESLEKVHQHPPASLLHSPPLPPPFLSCATDKSMVLENAQRYITRSPRLSRAPSASPWHFAGRPPSVTRGMEQQNMGRVGGRWWCNFILNDKRACECLTEIRAK